MSTGDGEPEAEPAGPQITARLGPVRGERGDGRWKLFASSCAKHGLNAVIINQVGLNSVFHKCNCLVYRRYC